MRFYIHEHTTLQQQYKYQQYKLLQLQQLHALYNEMQRQTVNLV